MSEEPKRRLTAGDLMRAETQTDEELKEEYGDEWQGVRTQAKAQQARTVKFWYTAAAWVTEWISRLPKMPTEPAVFSVEDITSMIQADCEDAPGTGKGRGQNADVHLLEWGKMIAEAIREGRASDIHRLADYVEKMQKCRPKGEPGSKAPWPYHAEGLQGVSTAVAQARLKIAKALRELLAEGAEINRHALAKRAGVPTVGGVYTDAFDTPELKFIPKRKSGVKPAIPTPKRRPKG
jgi:hypothetical protein